MLFAQTDGCSIFLVVGVIALLAEGLTRMTNRMLELQPAIRGWTIALGVISGIASFFYYLRSNTDGTSDPLLGALIASSLTALGLGLVWYFIVAVLTFLFQYLIVVPIQFLAASKKTPIPDAAQPRSGRGWFLLPLLGGFIGFMVGVVQLGLTLEKSPHLSGDAGLRLVGTYTISGTIMGFCLRLIFKIFGSWAAWSKLAWEKSAEKRRESAELCRIRDEEDDRQATGRRKDAAIQADRDAARKHLADFYSAHRELLAAAYPPALMEAFLISEMPDSLAPAQLWAICQKKITEFQPMIVQERVKKKEEEGRLNKRNLRLKQIDADIRDCKEKMARLSNCGLDPEFIEDETHGLLMKIRQMEEQKELLLTLNEVVDA